MNVSRIEKACTTFITAVALWGCGASPPAVNQDKPNRTLRMRHQILFASKEESHVFEGYMVMDENALMVKAFAGPGVDLFTVVRSDAVRCGKIHVPGLDDKMDIEAIGDDIARVYLGRCENPERHPRVRCSWYGEPLTETYDHLGRRLARTFHEAHTIGLSITYEEYEAFDDRHLPRKITLSWGDGSHRMVIRTLEIKPAIHNNQSVFQSC